MGPGLTSGQPLRREGEPAGELASRLLRRRCVSEAQGCQGSWQVRRQRRGQTGDQPIHRGGSARSCRPQDRALQHQTCLSGDSCYLRLREQISASETALPLLFTKSHLAQSQPPYTVRGGEEEKAALHTPPPACPSHPQPLLSPEVMGSARRGRRNGRLRFKSNLSREAGLDQQSPWWSAF